MYICLEINQLGNYRSMINSVLKAKPLEYIQVIDTDDEADVRRVIEFCGVPSHGMDQELIYHFEGSPYMFDGTELCNINGSFIIRLDKDKYRVMSEPVFKQLFELSV
ncbi:hypothetical protein LCS82_08625 [Vibrio harveyi]